ncbi:four helix bundle protein [Endozoicomonas ascidiicola]|uniref:four helix bundle protein n=1 Tax=Endozoicomonas ascidiicola TaxID=1698521 RepID=UPI000829553F|nr:four helix bundle protein [Endozoicomonas ascidiicola]
MTFENLDVWKRSSRLSVSIYKELAGLKDYGFKDQITRASLSIPSNIAEGLERESHKEKRHFLSIARGSAAELRTQIYIGIEIGYINKDIGKLWIETVKNISAMLQGLINSIRN